MALVDSIIGAESGDDPNARNPNSSASGAGQFIDSTWLDTLRSARPDLAQGKSDAELLALKTDPQLSRQMTEAYAAQNAAILSKAGQPVTPGTTYLAHFAGPQGAVSVLSADPATPIAQVLTPGAIAANPFLQGMTAGDLRSWADRKMGGGQQVADASPQYPNGFRTMQVGDYMMPQMGKPPEYRMPTPAVGVPIFAPQPPPQSQPQPQPQSQSQPEPEAPAVPFAQIAQMQMQRPPIFATPRKQIDLSKLRAAFGSPFSYRG